jgi:hypothetical protein
MHVLIAVNHIGGETHADSADKKGLSDGPPDNPPDDLELPQNAGQPR